MTSDDSALRVRGLARRYGSRAAVDNLDLDVRPGDLYGFLGPNGAGKTTAIRCILGLIRRDAGTVEILGNADPVTQRAGVGAMVETPRFHEWLSGRANLEVACAYAGRGTPAEIDRALERVGLAARKNDRVRGYSLGMKQRLGIARALVGEPRLLVLDEPTNGLDPRGMREVRELLVELARRDKLTVFVSSHLLSEVEAMCNRVGIIDKGVLKAEGRMDELLAMAAGRRQVEVAVDDRANAVRALAGIPGAEIVGDGTDGRIRVALDNLDAAGLNRALVLAGVGVNELLPRTGSLEELFLSVTSAEPGVEERA
ncbi:MAG: ABC transporter ATP-binding protein [Pseudomonadota bacterium]|nr:ABC transporter ATP-binding protein [Pseudomonadota bacterium]